jgi:hypothetical protein
MVHRDSLQAAQVAESEQRQENHPNAGPDDISETRSNVEYVTKQSLQDKNKKLRRFYIV